MKKLLIATATLTILAAPALAEGEATETTTEAAAVEMTFSGDVAKGEKGFKKCKSCHTVEAPDGTKIVKGGKTGPNLYGVMGRQAGSVEGFKYSDSLVAAGDGGLVWTEETFVGFTQNPKDYLKEVTGDSKAKSKMTFKLKKGGEDIAAFLASVVQ